MTTGTIFNIKKYAIHDGPGIRTTVFFSGCPLSCAWCHNPECSSSKAENEKGSWRTRKVTADYVMEIIEQDSLFYDESGGGATFSGGEPLLQADFLSSLLSASNRAGIHTAVDTCGLAPFSTFEQILDTTDLFLYDLKLFDESLHQTYTGKSNRQILENLKSLAALNAAIRIRIPLIPDITDTTVNLEAIARFVSDLHAPLPVDLLPYNLFAPSKYRRLNKPFDLEGKSMQSTEEMESFKQIFIELDIPVYS